MKIVLLSGSIRRASLNLKLVNLTRDVAARMGHEATVVDLGGCDIPVYNGDEEDAEGLPEDVLKLKQMISESDALVVSSPEYNGFFSGLLKNTLDWCSRAGGGLDGRATYEGKHCIVMSATPGAKGGVRVLPRLAEQMEILRTVVVDQVGIGNAETALGESATEARLEQALKQLG